MDYLDLASLFLNNFLCLFSGRFFIPIDSPDNTGCGISQLTAAQFVGGHILGN
jgi:hypothetical protein